MQRIWRWFYLKRCPFFTKWACQQKICMHTRIMRDISLIFNQFRVAPFWFMCWLFWITLWQIGGRVSDNTLCPRRYLPCDFSVARKHDKVNKVSLFSFFIFSIISNGSSKIKLVLHNPVTLRTSRNWQFRKIQRNQLKYALNRRWAKLTNYINAFLKKLNTLFLSTQSAEEKNTEKYLK